VKPYIEQGLQAAQGQYQQDRSTYAPFQQYTGQALNGIAGLAQNNALTGNATNLANQTLSGGFLGSNPYLDQTFNQAALATQNQLASQFAGAGRNVDQSEGLRSQQLNDLATQIYGGNYQAERDRQQQTLGMSPALGQAQYGGYDRLLGVGQSGSNALDQYLNRVGGNFGSSVKTSGGGNVFGGLLGAGILGGLF
jgi:hypothetical protein